MIDLDKAALTDRLFDSMDVEELQLLVENQSDEDVDDTRLWTRWVFLPGISYPDTLGINPVMKQEGTVTLQVFVPKGLGTADGEEVRDAFNSLFRQWRSPDKRLSIKWLKSETSTYKKGGSEFHLINCKAAWNSTRRANG